jgi:outer membrane protein assembly factor BamB
MLLYIGINSCVLAIDRASGQEVWRTSLKGSDFVNVVLDGSELFASSKGRLYCLDPATGAIRWENPLKGLGWGIVSIAGPAVSPLTAIARKRQQDEQAGSAAAVVAATS